MSLRDRLFIQPGGDPRPGGKAEGRIAVLSTAELRDWIDQYIYIIGRSLSEYSKDPTRREFLDEAVEASRLLHLCVKAVKERQYQ